MEGLSPEDQYAIEALRDSLVRAILLGDAEAYANSYSPDGIVMHPDTPLVQGSSALLEYAKAMFAAVKVTRLVLKPIRVVGEGRVAYEVGVQEAAVEPPNEHFKKDRQYLHAYERQEDGTWKVATGMSGNQ